MVDILDMEDIFTEILAPFFTERPKIDRIIAVKLIEEVKDFVDDQKVIACENCDLVEEPVNYRRAEMEDRD